MGASYRMLLFLLSVMVMVVSPVSCTGGVLLLKKAFQPAHTLSSSSSSSHFEKVVARDRARHPRVFSGIVYFPLLGNPDPTLLGEYYTTVHLGTPREFHLQFDTGSDVSWVACSDCSDCSPSTFLNIQLNWFNTSASSTAEVVSCSDPICTSTAAQCTDQCSYTIEYEDGSGTSGYHVADVLNFDAITPQSVVVPKNLVASITPRAFSHCLRGDGNGTLVLGEVVEPGIVYSPLVPSRPHYTLDLFSVSINGQTVFAKGSYQEAIVDSGTTLAYLVEEAFDALVNGVTAAVSLSQSVTPMIQGGLQCYQVPTSVSVVFPAVSLNFAGGASMVLKLEDYLQDSGSQTQKGASLWCIAFRKARVTILGDLVLKDKIIVYDLEHQRIGWTNYNCSLSFNVSSTYTGDSISAGYRSHNKFNLFLFLFLIFGHFVGYV